MKEMIKRSIDLLSGEKTYICECRCTWVSDYIVQNEEIYYFDNVSDLWKTDLLGKEKVRIKTETNSDSEHNEKNFMFLGEGWLYYSEYGDSYPCSYRSPLNDPNFATERFTEILDKRYN